MIEIQGNRLWFELAQGSSYPVSTVHNIAVEFYDIKS